MGAIGLTAPLGSTLTAHLKGYYHHNEGQGTWATLYVNSPTGVPIAVRTTECNIERYGVFGDVTADFGGHHLIVGGWFENNDFE